MTDSSRLLLIERVLPDDPREDLSAYLQDLNMLHSLSGRERSASEFSALLHHRYCCARDRPRSVTVVVTPLASSGEYTLYSSTQIPHIARFTLAGTTDRIAYLEEGDVAEIRLDRFRVVDSAGRAVSRAVRTPSRLEHDFRLDAFNPANGTFFRLQGDDDFETETAIAYELGYRLRLLGKLFVDVAAFYTDYENLLSLEPGAPFQEGSPERVVVPIFFRNGVDGDVRGDPRAEAAVVCAAGCAMRLSSAKWHRRWCCWQAPACCSRASCS